MDKDDDVLYNTVQKLETHFIRIIEDIRMTGACATYCRIRCISKTVPIFPSDTTTHLPDKLTPPSPEVCLHLISSEVHYTISQNALNTHH